MARDEWLQREIDQLLLEVAKTKNTDEVERLFDCILTPREINDMAKRLKIRDMLKSGKSYLEIRDTLLVSPNIVSRISNKIGYGFRRSNTQAVRKISESKLNIQKHRKNPLKYKGATPIHRALG
jgi:TrpR-related protein YerC/YecD